MSKDQKDQSYLYHGPVSGVSLVMADGSTREVMLHPGRSIPLPPTHPQVRTLLARGLLVPTPPGASVAPPPAAEAAPAKQGAGKKSTRKNKES